MAKLENDGTTEHIGNIERPRTDVRKTTTLALQNAEVLLALNGESSASVDLRGTFTATFVIEGSNDGTNFTSIPFYNALSELWSTSITSSGSFEVPNIAGFKNIKIRCSSYTSGSATSVINASLGVQSVYSKPIPTTQTVSNISASGSGMTLSLASPGTGLYHYITSIKIKRINNSATAITGTGLLSVTTTNLTGSPTYSSGNALAAGDDKTDEDLNFTGNPLKSQAANAVTTIVMPGAGTGVQYRCTVTFYTGA